MKDVFITMFVCFAIVAIAWLSGPVTVHVQHNISINAPVVNHPGAMPGEFEL